MKMIESWNSIQKGSTSFSTKRNFHVQKISEPGQKSESQERQKSGAQPSLRRQFKKEEGKRSPPIIGQLRFSLL